jgi:NodT family efflux transporter outer membrane factor (OMF) lipoprotein
LLGAALTAGCLFPPHEPRRVTQVQAESVGLAGKPETAPRPYPGIPTNWWVALGDPQLDRLVETGLADNPSLEAALARVRAARAATDVQRGGQLPQIDIEGSSIRERFPEHFIYPPPFAGATSWFSTYQANLNWTIDLFGRQRALVSSARASAEAAGLDAEAARLAVATSIVQAYIGLARSERLIAVADGFVRTRQDQLGYVRTRVKSKLASEFDLRQAETLLAGAEQVRTHAVADRDIAIHALAALVGRGIDVYPEIQPPTLALAAADVTPDALPTDLLGRRPDIQAGLARIDAAAAGRKVARTDFLPNISIQGFAGVAALGMSTLTSGGAETFGAGPAIHVPLFEGGKLRAQYRGATADLDGAVASYNDTVLRALKEAADALTQVRSADEDLAEEGRIVAGLRETSRLDQVRVSTGLGSRLDAVESGFRLLEAEQALIELQAQALSRRIELIAALGGGFDATAGASGAPRTASPASGVHP